MSFFLKLVSVRRHFNKRFFLLTFYEQRESLLSCSFFLVSSYCERQVTVPIECLLHQEMKFIDPSETQSHRTRREREREKVNCKMRITPRAGCVRVTEHASSLLELFTLVRVHLFHLLFFFFPVCGS